VPIDADRPSREPTELLVPTTRIDRGRRSKLPGGIAATGLSLFVVLAVWKPWDRPVSQPGPSGPAPSVTGRAGSGSDGTAPSPVPVIELLPNPIGPLPGDPELLSAATTRSEWGVRAMVLRAGGPIFTGQANLIERWVGAAANVTIGAPSLSLLDIAAAGDNVVAIGVTTPDDAMPLDVRFWNLPVGAPPQRLAPVAIVGPEPGSWLWLPDPEQATDAGTWPAGVYEIEVLVGPRIVRLVATIPNASLTSSRVETPTSQPPFGSILGSLEPGPFALADGGAQPLFGALPVVDEREAWLGPAAGLPPVAKVVGHQVTGVGMLFAAGDEPVRIDVRQLAQRSSPIETGVNIVAVEPGGRQAIVAWPLSGGVFDDGVYQVKVGWTTGGPDRSTSWTIEVQPSGQASPPNAPLDAMSRWVGLIDRPDIAAREPLIFVGDPSAPNACAGPTVIRASDPLVGIVVPPRVSVADVRLRPSGAAAGADIPIRFAPDAIPRLTVVALPPTGLRAGPYDLIVTIGSSAGQRALTQRMCVGAP
jgi:hypothetical protein